MDGIVTELFTIQRYFLRIEVRINGHHEQIRRIVATSRASRQWQIPSGLFLSG